MKVKIGSFIPTWFSDEESGKSQVLAVLPYTGLYPQFFNCVLRLTAPRTHKGWTEMAYQS